MRTSPCALCSCNNYLYLRVVLERLLRRLTRASSGHFFAQVRATCAPFLGSLLVVLLLTADWSSVGMHYLRNLHVDTLTKGSL